MTHHSDRDGFSHNDQWRVENPGLSAARGVLVAAAVSIPLWTLLAAAVWWCVR